MSSAGRPVPWANWTDWLEVYKWLDSSDAHDVQKGLDKVWLLHSMNSRQSGTLHCQCVVVLRLCTSIVGLL